MQHIETEAMVIRVGNVGENDRTLTLLTRQCGVVRAFARHSRAAKSRLVSSTQLFSYARVQLRFGKSSNWLDDAQPLALFFELRQDIARLALAQYFCELAGALAPREAEAGDFLRLLVCSLRRLCRGGRPLALCKAAVEMRMLSLAGYLPNLVGCAACGCYEAARMFFSPLDGNLLCEGCLRGESQGRVELGPGALTALRHTVYAELPKLFSFTLPAAAQAQLSRAAEAYIFAQLERGFKTLTFYHSVSDG